MRPHAADQICLEDQIVFGIIRRSVTALQPIDLGIDYRGQKLELSSHMLARAVAEVFGLACVDGRFLGMLDHSWIKTRAGNIIDVYPISLIGGPIMWDGNEILITSRLYKAMSESNAFEYYRWIDVPNFYPKVRKVTIELDRVATELGFSRTVAT